MNMRYIWQPFYTAYVLLTFAGSILVASPIFAIIALGNSKASREVIWKIISIWARGWLFMIGMPGQRIGSFPKEGKYVVIANHISYIDAIVLFPAIPRYFRPLGKKEFSKIPLLGFIYKQIVLMVDRSSKTSREKSMRLMWRTLRTDANIMIFPEGTFNETPEPLKEFYDGAFRLAISTQCPLQPIILADTVNRWHYSGWWKLSPGKNRIVYLDPVETTGLKAQDLEMLKTKVSKMMADKLVELKPSVK